MTRAQMFKRLAVGGASVAAVRAFPDSPQETAERVAATGAVVPVQVHGPLHLHGGNTVSHCVFHVNEKVPAAMQFAATERVR